MCSNIVLLKVIRLTQYAGDTILAQRAGSENERTHQGYVHEVRRDDIRISFHSSFKDNERYNVRFQYNRTPIRRQHQGLLAPTMSAQRLLFPVPGNEGFEMPIKFSQHPHSLYDSRIASNAAQLQAVESVVNLRSGAAPFVIFGP